MAGRKARPATTGSKKKPTTTIEALPNELLFKVIHYLESSVRLLVLRPLSRRWRAVAVSLPVDVNLHVCFQSQQDEAVLSISTLHISRGFPKFPLTRPPASALPAFSNHGSQNTVWASVSVGRNVVDYPARLLKDVVAAIESRLGVPRVQLIPVRIEVARPSSYSGTSTLLVEEPDDVQRLADSLGVIRMHLRADYRLAMTPTSSFSPILSLSDTLTHLDLEGPWLTSLTTDPMGLTDILSRLTNLTYLHADFNRQSIGTTALVNLIKALPNLVSFGCLGEINRSFWRSFQKKELNHLKHLVVGTRRETYSNASRIHTHMETLMTELPLGILWACPSLHKLSVFLGYYSGATTMDLLLNAIKRIRDGGLGSDPDLKSGLGAVDVYQAVDVGSVGWLRGWSVVGVGKGKGQGRVKVRVSTGAEMEPGRGMKVWDFG
ncbi:hypothetical protein HDV00_007391 [Rhizophlyctis rosea]|nr:hypothetical protein HDV00_007391 [Rhizophlyctis rosea]